MQWPPGGGFGGFWGSIFRGDRPRKDRNAKKVTVSVLYWQPKPTTHRVRSVGFVLPVGKSTYPTFCCCWASARDPLLQVPALVHYNGVPSRLAGRASAAAIPAVRPRAVRRPRLCRGRPPAATRADERGTCPASPAAPVRRRWGAHGRGRASPASSPCSSLRLPRGRPRRRPGARCPDSASSPRPMPNGSRGRLALSAALGVRASSAPRAPSAVPGVCALARSVLPPPAPIAPPPLLPHSPPSVAPLAAPPRKRYGGFASRAEIEAIAAAAALAALNARGSARQRASSAAPPRNVESRPPPRSDVIALFRQLSRTDAEVALQAAQGPVCRNFARGACTRPNCRWAHVGEAGGMLARAAAQKLRWQQKGQRAARASSPPCRTLSSRRRFFAIRRVSASETSMREVFAFTVSRAPSSQGSMPRRLRHSNRSTFRLTKVVANSLVFQRRAAALVCEASPTTAGLLSSRQPSLRTNSSQHFSRATNARTIPFSFGRGIRDALRGRWGRATRQRMLTEQLPMLFRRRSRKRCKHEL
jgi:hypothetical protein